MPTFDIEDSFWRDWKRLSREEKRLFQLARKKRVADLRRGQGLRGVRQGLRIKDVQAHPGIWELTWADDGRATVELGESPNEADVHIIWRRIGSHDILDEP
jgi:uncharacterized ferritin-like protein (DUF455 family)